MKIQKTKVNIVWLKRDLRLHDHAPLEFAIADELKIILLYVFEPSLLKSEDSDIRHFRFVYESILDINKRICPFEILVSQKEVIQTLDILKDFYEIKNILSHQEVGVKLTFDRDKSVKKWASYWGVSYKEFPQNGVVRGKKDREGWVEHLENECFCRPPNKVNLKKEKLVSVPNEIYQLLNPEPLPSEIISSDSNFQPGGETFAQRYLSSFLKERAHNYSKTLSKPAESRTGCSRLSPYLAFGCISVRHVIHTSKMYEDKPSIGWNIKNFLSRLWWRSHYIQKLETDWTIEKEPINPVFKKLNRYTEGKLLDVWMEGQTGYPMVDASMRCLQNTGWLNFRMRAMLVTFASFGLWLDFRPLALHLARLFLDYDPGIHYPQIQMQAGLTGYHTLRIFNPIQQVANHDAKGQFIKKWIPELEHVPPAMLSRPWEMSYMEQKFYRCIIGQDYPAPVIHYETALKQNRDRYWKLRQSVEAKEALFDIWRKFCIPSDIEKYKKQQDVCRFETEE